MNLSPEEDKAFALIVTERGDIHMHGLARLALGDKMAQPYLEPHSYADIRANSLALDLENAIFRWIGFHDYCTRIHREGPHKTIIDMYRAFAKGDVGRKLRLFSEVARIRTARTNLAGAVEKEHTISVSYPEAAALLAFEGREAVRASAAAAEKLIGAGKATE